MSSINSFRPIANASANRLILGTMPGTASLAAEQYYAHPRNAFWRILEAILQLPPGLDYAARCAALKTSNIALWDVLQSCTREGSLDSSIVATTAMPNAFASFLDEHPRITAIYFNGATAEKLYYKHVLPTLREAHRRIPTIRLPSTSPANASMSYELKLEKWRVIERA